MPRPIIPARCFAASNSAEGFRNYYGELFTDTHPDFLYVIKGGPGTGKSHFMKRVAHHARERGYTAVEYLCSSDPHSLDGLLLTAEGKPSLGFLDGTAPHGRDASLPGVREELIDLGRFLQGDCLRRRRDEISALSAAKAREYTAAYRYLKAAGEAEGVMDALILPCLRKDAIAALAERILRDQPDGETFCAIPSLRRAISMKGRVTLPSFEEAAASQGGRLMILQDHPTHESCGVAARLTELLLSVSRRKGLTVCVSYDPLIPRKIDGLYYPATGLCILSGQAEETEALTTRHVSLRRYLETEPLRAARPELRRALALRRGLLDAAEARLSFAAVRHFALEEIYAGSMDFRAKEAFTEEFCNEVIRR